MKYSDRPCIIWVNRKEKRGEPGEAGSAYRPASGVIGITKRQNVRSATPACSGQIIRGWLCPQFLPGPVEEPAGGQCLAHFASGVVKITEHYRAGQTGLGAVGRQALFQAVKAEITLLRGPRHVLGVLLLLVGGKPFLEMGGLTIPVPGSNPRAADTRTRNLP